MLDVIIKIAVALFIFWLGVMAALAVVVMVLRSIDRTLETPDP